MKRSIIIVLFIVALALFFFLRGNELLSLQGLQAQRAQMAAAVAENRPLALAVFFSVYVACATLSIPGAGFLSLVAGSLFGVIAGTIVVSLASTVGATLAFLLARYLFRDWVQRKYGANLQALQAGFARDGWTYLLSLRLLPIFPFFLVNLLFALTTLPTWTFALVSQIGMLPATIAYVNAGQELGKIQSTADIVSPTLLSALVILGLLPLVGKLAISLWRGRKIYRGHRKPKKFDYNLVVIGGGAAGLVTAYIAAAVKAKVALIERHRMGGDCLYTGCVPSKALLRSAKFMYEARHSRQFGVARASTEMHFPEIMKRVQDIIKAIEPHDSPERYQGLGVECIQGDAKIVSPWEVQVGSQRLSARHIVIATGARPNVPEIPGLREMKPLTSDNVWELAELPQRLLILGAGAIGCELAQAFARLGSQVTILEKGPRILAAEDREVSTLIQEQFLSEDIHVMTDHQALRFERQDGRKIAVCQTPLGEMCIEFDQVLVALGRKANTDGFGARELGIELNARGQIAADPFMRTNFPNIFVCGDVTGPYQFTHTASHQAWYCAVNALFSPIARYRADYRVIPWVTYTDPEVAHVGLSEQDALARKIPHEVTQYDIADLDRAIVDSAAHGFVKVLTPPGSDRILGVTIVGSHAGEYLSEFVLAMKYGLGMNKILGTVHAYPTLAEANKYAAGVWKKAHAPENLLKYVERFHRWRRS